jgi:hypothetical protein
LRTVGIAGVAASIAGFGGVAVGAIPGTGGKVTVCHGKIGGIVRVIDAEDGERCLNALEKQLTLNQQGPAGPKGDPEPRRAG